MRDGLSSLQGSAVATAGKIAAFGAAIGATAVVGSIAALAKTSGDAMIATSRLSKQLGVSTTALVGFQHAAKLSGAEVEMASESLSKLGPMLANAAADGGPAAEALKRMGLDAKVLASGDIVTAFGSIGDGLNNIQNPAERAAASVAIFGEEGLKLGSLLSAGSKGIDAATKDAEKLGLTFSAVDSANVNKAWKSVGRLWDALTGVGNVVITSVAPAIEMIADILGRMIPLAQTVGKVVASGFKVIATVIGTVIDKVLSIIDWIPGISIAANDTGSETTKVFDDIAKSADATASAIKSASGNMVGMGKDSLTTAEGVKALTAKLREQIKTYGMSSDEIEIWKLRQGGANAMQMYSIFSMKKQIASQEQLAKQGQGIQALNDKLREQIKTYGMTADQIEVWKLKQLGATKVQLAGTVALQQQVAELDKLAKRQAEVKEANDGMKELSKSLDEQIRTFGLSSDQVSIYQAAVKGATTAEIKQAKALLEKRDAMEANKAKQDEQVSSAKSLFEETRTPMEQAAKKMGDITELLNAGLIDKDTFQRAARQITAGIENRGPRGGGALDARGNEARSLVLANATMGQSDPIKDVARSSRTIVSEHQKGNQILTRLLQQTQGGAELFQIG